MAAPVLALPSRAVFDALSRSGALAVTSETTADELAAKLVALRAELTGADALTVALCREHVLRELRELSYVDAPVILNAALGRPGDARWPGIGAARTAGGPAAELLGELAVRLEISADRAWLVRDYLGLGELFSLYGAGKVGKSTFAASLAAAVARGEPFLERSTTQGGVLWLDNENHATRVVRKLAEAGCPADAVLVLCGPPPTIADLRPLILEHNIKLVVVDSLIGLLRPEDENDAAEIRNRIAPLLDLAHETQATVLAISHARKSPGEHGDAMRGSSALRDAVDGYIEMARVGGGEPDDERRQLTYEGRDDAPPRQLVVRRSIGAVDEESVLRTPLGVPIVQTNVSYTTARGPAQERRDKITAALEHGPLDADAIAGEVGTVKSTILGDLELLRGTGRVARSGAGRKGDPYIFSLSAFVR